MSMATKKTEIVDAKEIKVNCTWILVVEYDRQRKKTCSPAKERTRKKEKTGEGKENELLIDQPANQNCKDEKIVLWLGLATTKALFR